MDIPLYQVNVTPPEDGPSNRSEPLSRTAEQYASSLRRVYKQSLQTELFSRVHYQSLSNYLSSAFDNQGAYVTEGFAQRRANFQFTHVVVHTIANGTTRRDCFDHSLGLERFLTFPKPEPKMDQIIFVRGSPSPAWINLLGAKYKVEPEFFRRHLRYLPGRDHSDHPTLPSATTNTLSLSVISLYSRSRALGPEEIINLRNEDHETARRNTQAISAHDACGETIVRKFSTLNDRLLAMEHEISIYIRERKNESCLAIVLLDNGLNMNRRDGPPCFSRHDSLAQGCTSNEISMNTIIIPRPKAVHIGVSHPEVPQPDLGHANHANSICHVAALLPFYFGMTLTHCLTPRLDMAVLLGDVFRLAASSECQFLNRVNAVVKDQQRHLTDEQQMELALSTLISIKTLIDEHKQRFKETIAFLKSRGALCHDNSVSGSIAPQSTSQEGLTLLHVDFEELLDRAENIGSFCVESMSLVMNRAMLKESRKAVERADDQKRLTVLAYLFLPLSLVSSIFGMNVTQLGTGSAEIWLAVVIAIPVAILAWVLTSPKYLEHITGYLVYVVNMLGWKQQPKATDASYQTHGATNPLSTSRTSTGSR